MNILGVVPARGGSKGIPHKNIAPLAGKPLLTYTIEAALRSGVCKEIAVSTDDDAIIVVAKQSGAKELSEAVNANVHRQDVKESGLYVVRRPADISGDNASTEAALLHALKVMEEKSGSSYDAVMTLQPTSPFRAPETMRQFATQFAHDLDRFDALLTLHENRADHWIYDRAQGAYRRLYPDAPRRRQDREPLYIENSCIYLTTADALKQTGSVLGRRVNGFVISEEEGLDINEPVDLLIAEQFAIRRASKEDAAASDGSV